MIPIFLLCASPLYLLRLCLGNMSMGDCMVMRGRTVVRFHCFSCYVFACYEAACKCDHKVCDFFLFQRFILLNV